MRLQPGEPGLRWARRIGGGFRHKRFQQFRELLDVSPNDQILDLGGVASSWIGSGLEANVTCLNIRPPKEDRTPTRWVEGDACDLSRYEDRSFDIVSSNSLIEHVGSFDNQMQMAREVRRVARRYWMQAPYKHFPLEPHFLFPFFQYLSDRQRGFVAQHWPLSFDKVQGDDPLRSAREIRLLDKQEWRTLFPDASYINERFLGLTKSLIAYRPGHPG